MSEKKKLIALLRACDKKELAALRRFVASPYFNQRASLVDLLDYLLPLWPDFPAASLQPVIVFEKIYPNQAFNDKAFRYLSSGLGQLVEQFWAIERWQTSGQQPQLALLAAASERGVEKTYQKITRKLDLSLQQTESNTRLSDALLERIHWLDTADKHFVRSRTRRYDGHLQQVGDGLDRYYFFEKLKNACTMLDRQTIVAGQYHTHLSEHWMNHLQQQAYFGDPTIRLYFQVFKTLTQEDTETLFEDLRDLLMHSVRTIPMGEISDIFQLCINYCARKIRKGRDRFVEEALNLYQWGLDQMVLLSEGQLSPWAYTNIIKLAMRLRRYEWGEYFLHQFAPQLPPEFRDNALHYNLAELLYYTRRFDDAMLHLNQVAFNDLNYYLGARVMLAKIYYDKQEQEPLLSLLAAFTIFLKRNKEISSEIKQTYLNFCDILLQLVRRHPRRLLKLAEQIDTTPLLTDRQWLMDQLVRL
jgi:hypothetical protein